LQDNESFLHRSGRTGRAGNKGTALVMHTEREGPTLGSMLKQIRQLQGEVVGTPDPADVMRAASK
jgi:superfamily II DNA/RNA helicase